MSDTTPDQLGLHRRAYSQDGYFTAEQARERGFSPQLLAHHVRAGRYERVRRGLYRLAGFPGSGSEEVRAKWMAVGAERAVVSHESALELHGLSDVMPNAVHILVAREDRGIKPPTGVVVHTTSTPFRPDELTTVEGIRTTSPARAILDAATGGTATDQVVMALRQALDRGVVDSTGIQAASERRSRRVRALVRTVIAQGEDR